MLVYEYCCHKLERLKKAASASYTFYLTNPEDNDVKTNIAFYRDKIKVPEEDFVDLELKPYKACTVINVLFKIFLFLSFYRNKIKVPEGDFVDLELKPYKACDKCLASSLSFSVCLSLYSCL